MAATSSTCSSSFLLPSSATSIMPPATSSSSYDKDKQKKPRHRHSPAQLFALNELFEKDEHPPLEIRVSLAGRLGMETKTVNAWFQNRRASSKKRILNRHTAQPDSNASPSSLRSLDFDEYDELYQSPYPENSRANFEEQQDILNRRSRMRPTTDQVEQLKVLFNVNPLPSTEEKQALANRIGMQVLSSLFPLMRYQSITTWFQNQRSILKKRLEGDSEFTAHSDNTSETRRYSAFPPPTHHPSLNLPPPSSASSHPPLPSLTGGHRSLSPDPASPRRTLSSRRRSATPYDNALSSRPRRTRPEPYQLDALKDMFLRTAHPSIEERTALALQIGMQVIYLLNSIKMISFILSYANRDVGKVTNWFRNLRQTTRRRAQKAGSGDDDDYEDIETDFPDRERYYTADSRSNSPSTSTWTNEESTIYDEKVHLQSRSVSDAGSDDEYEEAVTPNSESSRSPPPPLTRSPASQVNLNNLTLAALESATLAEMEKVSSKTGIKVEDALLLLTFHHQVVQ
ncbi:hypothetical protein D9757_002287 [Collybiopsis confluens]|uniref:Homeobox domain-containing protein n=1 Tax=Collybiopsis confluens TaxID=2823264 RepID=A0A8H5MFU3_9AGAR|nr:hypothetical protein D9757_002287 [Collybiopsis confluens]